MFKKKAITIIASEETFNNLSSFETITELNETVRYYKDTFTSELNKNAVRVLNLLHRYSAKFKGVSFLAKNNIANQLEISKRTVIRACQRLEKLGIIKQYEMKRQSDMNQTSNAIVIQPIEVDENTDVTQDMSDFVTQADTNSDDNCHSNKTNSLLKQNLINNRNSDDTNDTQFDHTFVSENVPKEFVETVSMFFPDADDIYSVYKRLLMATRSNRDTLFTHMDNYIKTFKTVVYRSKTIKIRSFFGYLYRAFEQTSEHIFRHGKAKNSLFYEYLYE